MWTTLCLKPMGLRLLIFQKKLGHRYISITLNTYAEVLANYEDTCDNAYLEYLEENKIGCSKIAVK